jgi:hypothetical protein
VSAKQISSVRRSSPFAAFRLFRRRLFASVALLKIRQTCFVEKKEKKWKVG